jgi:hypothetical protein
MRAVVFLCALLVIGAAGRGANDETAAPLNAQSTLDFNRNHVGSF